MGYNGGEYLSVEKDMGEEKNMGEGKYGSKRGKDIVLGGNRNKGKGVSRSSLIRLPL